MASFTVLETSTATIFTTGTAPASKSWNFFVAPNGNGYLDFQVLGGANNNGGPAVMNLRIKVNDNILGVFQFHRWTDHSVLVLERSMVIVPANVLKPYVFPFVPVPINTLVIEAASGVAGDYFFIGPLIYHTN